MPLYQIVVKCIRIVKLLIFLFVFLCTFPVTLPLAFLLTEDDKKTPCKLNHLFISDGLSMERCLLHGLVMFCRSRSPPYYRRDRQPEPMENEDWMQETTMQLDRCRYFHRIYTVSFCCCDQHLSGVSSVSIH